MMGFYGLAEKLVSTQMLTASFYYISYQQLKFLNSKYKIVTAGLLISAYKTLVQIG